MPGMPVFHQFLCRRCRETVADGFTRLTVQCGPLRDRDGLAHLELCGGCAEELGGFLRGGAVGGPAEAAGAAAGRPLTGEWR